MDRSFKTIEGIFALQERMATYNQKQFNERYKFVKDCVELVLNCCADNDVIISENKEKEASVFRIVFDAGLSSIINATKLLTYGVPGDSLACLRVSLEAFICVDYMITFNAYSKIREVIFNGQGDLNCKEYAKHLQDKDKAEGVEKKDKKDRHKMHCMLSQKGSHLLLERLKLSRFTLNGRQYPQVGQGLLDEKTAFNVSGLHTQIAMYMVNVCEDFFKSIKNVAPDYLFPKAEALRKRYEEDVRDSKKQVKIWEKVEREKKEMCNTK